MTTAVRSSRGKELLLLACAIVLSLLLGEGATRTLLPKAARAKPGPANIGQMNRSDPKMGWILSSAPIHYRHRLVDQQGVVQYDVVYSVADEQRRTSERSPDAPLLVSAGCSFTFGQGLNDRDSWPWLLQEQLPYYHVVNVGAMGYGTDQALLAAERQILKNPGQTAAVVLGFADFQIERNRGEQGWLAYVYPFSKPLYTAGANGPEYRRQVHFWSWGAFANHSELLAHLANNLANTFYQVPSHKQVRQITLDLITTFAKRMHGFGIKFAVVMLPYGEERSLVSRTDKKFMIDGLEAAKIPVLDPRFPRLGDNKFDLPTFMVSRIDLHPNRAYNVVLTRQLKPFLESSGVIAAR